MIWRKTLKIEKLNKILQSYGFNNEKKDILMNMVI